MACSSSSSSHINIKSDPIDTDVLWMQPKHVPKHVWNGEEERKLHIRRAVPTYQGEEQIPEQIFPFLLQSGFAWIIKMGPQEDEIRGSVVKLSWLAHHFDQINNDDDEEQVRRFARAWILKFIGGVLFVDKTSNRVSVRWLRRGNQHIDNDDVKVFRRKFDIMKRHEGKHDENWGQLFAPMIQQWNNRHAFRVDAYPRQEGLLSFNSDYMVWYRRKTKMFVDPENAKTATLGEVAEALQYMVSPQGRKTCTFDDLVPYVEKITILSEEQERVTEPVSHGPASERQFPAQ
ncbi:Protein MAIN-LIKE 2 [Glycine max]|nr:Protein MAIN-LIKE 2 [Glycine max]